MPHIIVASGNPVKIESARRAFEQVFGQAPRVEGIAVSSGVADQPLSDSATLRGARNRVRAARRERPEADFWVGIEGGVDYQNGHCEAFGWIVVRSGIQESSARSATFPLPASVGRRLRGGDELGPLVDRLFDEENTKQKGGAVGLLTNGIITRQALYLQPLIFALLPFRQPDLYDE